MGTYDLSGGLLSVSTNVFVGPERQVTNVISKLTVRDAGSAQIVGDIWMGGYKSVNGTATLTLKTGGVLSVKSIRVDSTVINGTTKIVFDGGVLRPTVDTTSFLGGLTQAALTTNGAFINSAGRNISIRQTLDDAAGQAGRLVKLGAGTLTLTNANTFSGETLVSNGTLRVCANTTLACTNWVIAAGATNKFDSSVNLTGKNVMIDAGGTGISGLLDVTGNLTLGGKLTVLTGCERQKIAQCTGTLSGAFAESSLPVGCVLRTLGGKELWVIRLTGTLVRVL
jgi:autotransporter-associated beta strand protein